METGKQTFELSRFFSLTSLVGILVVAVGLSLLYRYIAFNALTEHESRSNVTLTQAFVNAIWPDYSAFIENAHLIPKDELPQRTEIKRLKADVLRHMHGISVVKVKIYHLNGLTVFSTEERQIGEDKSRNPGFQRAKAGEPVSEITYRQQFDAFEQVVTDRDLVFSYVPIRKSEAAPVEAVFEIYSDVTQLVASLEKTQWQIVAGVVGGMALLYAFLFLIVRRADRIIKDYQQEMIANEAKIRHEAYYDSLTGLPNRRDFAERLTETLKRAKRTGNMFGVLFLDIDRFKLINDSLGHHAGDELLQIAARRIQSCVRESDSVFRLGGDEFTVIAEGLEHSEEEAALVARRIIEAVSKPATLDGGRELIVTTSIGIAIFPNDGTDADKLMKNADAAMYLAKESGRNRYQFHSG